MMVSYFVLSVTFVALTVSAPTPQSINDPRTLGMLRRIFGLNGFNGLNLGASESSTRKRQVPRTRSSRGSQFNSQRRRKCSTGTILNIAGECTEPIIERRVFVYTSPSDLARQNARQVNPSQKQQIDYHLVLVNSENEGNQLSTGQNNLNFDTGNDPRRQNGFLNQRDLFNNLNNFEGEFDLLNTPSNLHSLRQQKRLPQQVIFDNGLPSKFRSLPKPKPKVSVKSNLPLGVDNHKELLQLLLRSHQEKDLNSRQRVRTNDIAHLLPQQEQDLNSRPRIRTNDIVHLLSQQGQDLNSRPRIRTNDIAHLLSQQKQDLNSRPRISTNDIAHLLSQQEQGLNSRTRVRTNDIVLPKRGRKTTRIPSRGKNLQRYVIVEQSNPNLEEIQKLIREVNREAHFRNLRHKQKLAEIEKLAVSGASKLRANQEISQSIGSNGQDISLDNADKTSQSTGLDNTKKETSSVSAANTAAFESALEKSLGSVSESALETSSKSVSDSVLQTSSGEPSSGTTADSASLSETSESKSAAVESGGEELVSGKSLGLETKSEGPAVAGLGKIFAKLQIVSETSSDSKSASAIETSGDKVSEVSKAAYEPLSEADAAAILEKGGVAESKLSEASKQKSELTSETSEAKETLEQVSAQALKSESETSEAKETLEQESKQTLKSESEASKGKEALKQESEQSLKSESEVSEAKEALEQESKQSSKSESEVSEAKVALEQESEQVLKSKSETSEAKKITEQVSQTESKTAGTEGKLESSAVNDEAKGGSADKKSSDSTKESSSKKDAQSSLSKKSNLGDSKATDSDSESFIKINISSIKDFPLVYVKLNENHKKFKAKN